MSSASRTATSRPGGSSGTSLTSAPRWHRPSRRRRQPSPSRITSGSPHRLSTSPSAPRSCWSPRSAALNNTTWTVARGQQGTAPAPALGGAAVTPTEASQDRQFLDFSPSAPFSVYNWELFYHIPLYIAQLLSQNQQFEDAQTWFQYIFNPTRQGSDPVPQRFWIPKPLHNLTSAQILAAADQQPAAGRQPGRSRPPSPRSRPGATIPSTRSCSPTCAPSPT